MVPSTEATAPGVGRGATANATFRLRSSWTSSESPPGKSCTGWSLPS